MFTPNDIDGSPDAQEANSNGPTSPAALRDLLDAVDLEHHGVLVKLFASGLAWEESKGGVSDDRLNRPAAQQRAALSGVWGQRDSGTAARAPLHGFHV